MSSPRSQSFLRGTIAGIAAHYVTLLTCVLILLVARPLFWAAVYGVPYTQPAGPIDPNTNYWLLLQAINLASWIAAGAAAARWSKPGSWAPIIALNTAWVGFTVYGLTSVATSMSAFHIAIWLIQVPAGTLLGALMWLRRERRLVAHIAATQSQ